MRTDRTFRSLLAVGLLSAGAAAAAPFAYVPVGGSFGRVSVIDLATDAVVATVAVGENPMGVAVGPGGARIYIGNRASRTVSVIDGATNAVVATIPVPRNPVGIAVNAAGTRVYVCGFPDRLHVIDATTNTLIADVGGLLACHQPAVLPSAERVFVTDRGSNSVAIFDAATLALVGTIPTGTSPWGIAVNPAGTRAYVANFGDLDHPASVAVIDTGTLAVVATVGGIAGNPVGVATDPAGTRVYVSAANATVSPVLDTANNAVIATVPVGGSGVALDPTGTRVYYVVDPPGAVSVVDARTYGLVTTIPVGAGAIAFGRFIAPGASAPQASAPIPALGPAALVAVSFLVAGLGARWTRGRAGRIPASPREERR